MSLRLLTLQDLFYVYSALDLAILSSECPKGNGNSDRTRLKACVMATVVSSVSFIECSINGLYDYAQSDLSRRTKLHRGLAGIWHDRGDRQPILAKYQVALALGGREVFRKDRDPYQSAAALVELRNEIAHPKELIGSDKQQRLEKTLHGKYEFGPKEPHVKEFFPARCLSLDCAKWAVMTSSKFVLEFNRRMPPTAYLFPSSGHLEAIIERVKRIDSRA
jgi:hypothetical protein